MVALEIQNTLTAENPDSNRKKKRRMVVRGGTSPVNRCNWLPRSAATVEVPSSGSGSFSSNAIVKLFVFQKNLQTSTTTKHKTTTQPDDQLLCKIFPNLAQLLQDGFRWKALLASISEIQLHLLDEFPSKLL